MTHGNPAAAPTLVLDTQRPNHGTKLSYAPASRVAFEIDGFDSSTGVGWSVVVKGVAHDVTDAADDFSWAARGAAVYPLASDRDRAQPDHRPAIPP
jgi:hypothetical protein